MRLIKNHVFLYQSVTYSTPMKSIHLFLTLLLSMSISPIHNPQAQTNEYTHQPEPYVKLTHPEWSKDATIYQINTRQFTKEGTFKAAEEHLPRLKELGVDILWLMPIHEIGEKNRKGSLGSPYSVKDYYSVNPEFGTDEDFQRFIDKAHTLGFKVILDWVANHTAWDNPLTEQHPDWYERDWKGDFRPTPWWDWSDIIDLDYSKPGVRRYMADAMKYWVSEFDIDGYRCDVAGFVPIDFWNTIRKELHEIKPVFMLAEWESRDLHAEAFDMTYAWSWYDAVHNIIKGTGDMNGLFVYYSWNESAFPENSYRMTFVSNHDKNAWDGTMYEQFGDGLEAAIVLSVVGEGMPLIYNGQEAGNDKRLEFFEKDEIEWKEDEIGDLYTKLFRLKKDLKALWNGKCGARMIRVENSAPMQVFSFVRENESEKVFALMNFSDEEHDLTFPTKLQNGNYTDYFTEEDVSIDEHFSIKMKAWDYRVLVMKK